MARIWLKQTTCFVLNETKQEGVIETLFRSRLYCLLRHQQQGTKFLKHMHDTEWYHQSSIQTFTL